MVNDVQFLSKVLLKSVCAITQRKITWTWPQYFFTEIQFRNSSCFSKFFRVINSLPDVKSFLELKFTSSVSICVTPPSTEPWLRIWFVKLTDLKWRHSQVRAGFPAFIYYWHHTSITSVHVVRVNLCYPTVHRALIRLRSHVARYTSVFTFAPNYINR